MTDHGPAIIPTADAGIRCESTDMLPGQCAHCKGVDLNCPPITEATFLLDAGRGFDVILHHTLRSNGDGQCQLAPLNPFHAICYGDEIGYTDIGYVCKHCVQRLA